MRIAAIAMARNESDIITESVSEALRWADDFVIYDHGSTDGTGQLAVEAGATVIFGNREPWGEHLRQHTLDLVNELQPDWVWRIDIDEIYHPDPNPRLLFKDAQKDRSFCIRALQAEFWLTLDDVRRGLLLEDETVSVQKRRRWYTIGHRALVAWRWRPDLRYYGLAIQKRKNVPLDSEGKHVAQLGPTFRECLLQKHYNCRSLPQVLRRMQERREDFKTFGKYRYNVIIDEKIGLHYLGPPVLGEEFDFADNHALVYAWYKESLASLNERKGAFKWHNR